MMSSAEAGLTSFEQRLVGQHRDQLIKQSVEARLKAYCPYSRYQVGACLLLADGRMVQGCNVENAAYPSSICAERCAVFSAVALHNVSGKLAAKPRILAMAVATREGGASCGGCRQVLNEMNPEMRLWMVDERGEVRQDTTVRGILPSAFDPEKAFEPILRSRL